MEAGKKILRFWVQEAGEAQRWFQNSIEFLNHMKTHEGKAPVVAGCRAMTIEEWRTFKAQQSS